MTDEDIRIYDKDTYEVSIITTLSDSQIGNFNNNFFNVISFGQFSSDEGGYALCRYKHKIFVLKDERIASVITNNDIEKYYAKIITYKKYNYYIYFMISYIDENNKFNLLMYNFHTSSLKAEISLQYQSENLYLENAISCDFMYISEEKNDKLVCFLSELNSKNLITLSFDPLNNLEETILSKKEKEYKIEIIKSAASPDKTKNLVCFINSINIYQCSLYDSFNNIWAQDITLLEQCLNNNYETKVYYESDLSEYIVSIFSENTLLHFFRFDENFKIKDKDAQGNKCYLMKKFEDCEQKLSASSFYYVNKRFYAIFIYCIYQGQDKLYSLNIEKECNYQIEIEDFEFEISLSEISTSTFSTTPSSISILSSNITNVKFGYLDSISNLIYSNILSSISPFNNYDKYENGIIFYNEGDIIRGKINKTKEEIENNFDEIMNIIEIGKKYKLDGDNYNITITPINDISIFNSSYIELMECENILRNKYDLSSKEILTILQIEIDKNTENSLTNQIEYVIYIENKTKLDLSYCNGLRIKINYEIKDKSILNKSMINYYSNMDIDIFNINDSFFNDICYPFSNSVSDIILKDRVSDIYQNYSLCDNNCEYDKFNIDNMTVSCYCLVKTEVNIKVEPPKFKKVVKDTFKDSNFGVIKCYKLVFNFKNKKSNIGFWIFLFFVIFHIPLFIYYFIFKIKSIKDFVFREMVKNNYLEKKMNPPKSLKNMENSNKKIINLETNIFSPFNTKNSKNRSLSVKSNNLMKKNKLSLNRKTDKNYIRSIDFSSSSNIKIIPKRTKINKLNNNINKSLNKSSFSRQLFLGNNKNKIKSKKKEIYNEENKKFPGYYQLIQINANNSENNKPPQSKYILDNYDYYEAIKYDKREFWRIFYIILLSKENILNTFFFKSSLELQSIRLSIFIFNYSCDFALNALFYLNEKISDKYHYEGENLQYYTLINNITICITSTLFSFLLLKSLGLLTNSKDEIEYLFRKEEKKMRKNKNFKVNIKTKKIINQRLIRIFKILKIKIIIYIIIEFILMLFFLYYITAFCEVYKETQINWLIDSIVSLLLSIITEIFISFIYTTFYIISIRIRIKILYKIVLFLYGIG